MSSIKNLQPELLWKHFYSLTQIPRPSKKEQKAVDFVKKFGEESGLETIVDDVGNVIIRKSATPGYENRKTVVLQSHLDMVPQKNSDVAHDFEKDPIKAYVDGEWVKAEGTTLGADNGMGVAAALAVLESDEIEHGPVEALFTIDEETGMTGAFELKPGLLKADILLNMDSEDEGELYIGCAGGMNTSASMEYSEESVPADMKSFKVSVKGLKGGHSGLDIHLGKGNANKIMNRFLWYANEKLGMRISKAEGGNLRNAIPREAFVEMVIPAKNEKEFLQAVSDHESMFRFEFSGPEPDLQFIAESCPMPSKVMDKDSQNRLIRMVYGIPNGVMRMSTDMEGVVETSTNLAIVEAAEGKANVLCLIRSAVDSAKFSVGDMTQSVMELADAKVSHDGIYPGWKPNPDSPVLKTMIDVYDKNFGKTPEIKVIHAGLECGIIGDSYPGLDMISFGPTIRFPHSPDEKVNIETVQKFWDFLIETLKNIPVK